MSKEGEFLLTEDGTTLPISVRRDGKTNIYLGAHAGGGTAIPYVLVLGEEIPIGATETNREGTAITPSADSYDTRKGDLIGVRLKDSTNPNLVVSISL